MSESESETSNLNYDVIQPKGRTLLIWAMYSNQDGRH